MAVFSQTMEPEMDLFILKKVIGLLLMPISIITLLLILAIVLFKARRSLSLTCLMSASLILVLSSLSSYSS